MERLARLDKGRAGGIEARMLHEELHALRRALLAKAPCHETRQPELVAALEHVKDAINYRGDEIVDKRRIVKLLALGRLAGLLAWPTRGVSLALTACLAGPLPMHLDALRRLGVQALFSLLNECPRPLELRLDAAGKTAVVRRNPESPPDIEASVSRG